MGLARVGRTLHGTSPALAARRGCANEESRRTEAKERAATGPHFPPERGLPAHQSRPRSRRRPVGPPDHASIPPLMRRQSAPLVDRSRGLDERYRLSWIPCASTETEPSSSLKIIGAAVQSSRHRGFFRWGVFQRTGFCRSKYARAHEKRKPDRLVENSAIRSLPRVFTPD